MGLKTLLTKNAWNEQHVENIELLKEYGLCDKSGINRDFLKYADNSGMNIRKEPLNPEFIKEYLQNSNVTDCVTDYDKELDKYKPMTTSDKIRFIIFIILLCCIICCTVYATFSSHSSAPLNIFMQSLPI